MTFLNKKDDILVGCQIFSKNKQNIISLKRAFLVIALGLYNM